ncbi:hypothetical protein BaRGS_00009972 [Batillaria attramentaria]|uniref:Uncharacterized protein n=1 Tax=Batillaria attramentaria TaxID=370345 RepID=A0ABD0LHL3_9CAEN
MKCACSPVAGMMMKRQTASRSLRSGEGSSRSDWMCWLIEPDSLAVWQQEVKRVSDWTICAPTHKGENPLRVPRRVGTRQQGIARLEKKAPRCGAYLFFPHPVIRFFASTLSAVGSHSSADESDSNTVPV